VIEITSDEYNPLEKIIWTMWRLFIT